MSKSVSIKEGTTSSQFNEVKKIKLNNVGSGSSYWVPEDETQLGTKHITENGTYKASEEEDESGTNKGWYGYSQVTVSGIGKTTFTAEDGDRLGGNDLEGNEDYSHDKDGVKLLPSRIGFSSLPSKLVYDEGEHIALTNAIVRAYKRSGGDWSDNEHPNGVIPHTELTINPTTAHYDPSKGGGKYTPATGILVDAPSYFEQTNTAKWYTSNSHDTYTMTLNGNVCIAYEEPYPNNPNIKSLTFIAASKTSPNVSVQRNNETPSTGRQVTFLEKTFYCAAGTYWHYANDSSENENIQSLDKIISVNPEYQGGGLFIYDYVAYAILFGDYDAGGSAQDINVKWKRPIDFKELETSFEVHVNKPSS